MAEPFKHPYLSQIRWLSAISPDTGGVRHTMVVVPNLPIDEKDSTFDQKEIDELVDAATMYAKSHGSAFDVQIFGIA